jgi:hypothetical protein
MLRIKCAAPKVKLHASEVRKLAEAGWCVQWCRARLSLDALAAGVVRLLKQIHHECVSGIGAAIAV